MLGTFAGKFVQLDPDEVMEGTCKVCKTSLTTTRRKTVKDKPTINNQMMGAWVDIPYVECPTCKEESAGIIKRAGTKRTPIGTKVYVQAAVRQAPQV